MEFVDLKTQYAGIKDSVDEAIHRVLEHGRFIMGPEVGELEEALANYAGSKHCIGVASGTDALMIAMMALGIGAGDEVITTPFTFIATGEMIALLGATPVYVDIEPDTYNIAPAAIEAAITSRTKAIMPVSLYGQCADFDAINRIGEQHGIPVIEDGAQSFGATYHGRRSCALSELSCTSFFPSKPLGCYGDGGACFTENEDLAKVMREIRVHGQDRRYHHPRVGVNGRLDTMQAAILLSKMAIFDEEVAARGRIGARYTELILERGDRVIPPRLRDGNTSVYAQYTVQVDQRDQVLESLRDQGIPTAVHYPVPLHLQPVMRELGVAAQEGSLPVAEHIAQRVVSLPMHPYLDASAQEHVVDCLFKAVS